ncbi:MAG: membrane-bound PQQ-dependent dehydrogenase, glucose/quinate/shikimate family [Pseudomonadales bacterium]
MSGESQHPRPRVLAVFVGLIGLALLWQGLRLIMLGGSWYYAPAGLALLLCAVDLFAGRPRAAWVFVGFMAFSVVWALYEAGTDLWALMPRLWIFGLLSLWMLLPRVRRGLWQTDSPPPVAARLLLAPPALMIVLLVAFALMHLSWPVTPAAGLGTGALRNPPDWIAYGGDLSGTRFAPHDEVNLDNVGDLERLWTFRTGVPGTFKGTPIQVDDHLFLCTGQNIIVSLDPDTGTERWRFDPKLTSPHFGFWDTCRGVTHYAVPAARATSNCPTRVFTATTDARLIAVDGETGQRCQDFGSDGEISLLPGMGEVKPGFYFVTSPPTIANDVLVLGGWVADNQETEEPSGVVRGFDPVTGDLVWAWDMGRLDRSSLPPEGESYTRGTPNVWSLTSADESLGLIYVPTGNATPDYYGGHRSEAMETYSSSVVALDSRTGSVRWHFQTTHHDIWDYDVPSQPTLVDIPGPDGSVKAVVVPTKRGEIFLLNRETGEPIADVTERPVPPSDVPGEHAAPTQPFSTGMPSFAHPTVTEHDLWGFTVFDQLSCRIQFRQLRWEGLMTPPSLQGTLLYPGPAGGMNWGSVAVDEKNQLMVVNVLHMPFTVQLIPRDELEAAGGNPGGPAGFGIGGRQGGTPYAARTLPFFSPLFMPCLQPPFGEMGVVDLTTRKLVWKRALGNAQLALGEDLRVGIPVRMGLPYQAGSAVTAGGLIFMGGTIDGTLRAIDLFTGREVWSDRLPSTSNATPMSYVSPKTGRQYVIVTVPGDGSIPMLGSHEAETGHAAGEPTGGYVIAYGLRD